MEPEPEPDQSQNQNLQQDHGSVSGSDFGKMIRFQVRFRLRLHNTE